MRIPPAAAFYISGLLTGGFGTAALIGQQTHAQAPQPTAHERALEATVNELQQAWTAARTAWIAAQDENARLAAEVKAKSERIAQLEAERAKAIPAPEAKP